MSCNNAFNCFHDCLLASIDEHTPEKSVKIGCKSVQPWMSKGLLKCLSKQKRLYSTTLKLPKDDPKVLSYKAYRACLQKIKRKAKIAHYSEKCKNLKQNTKKLWEVINKVIGKTQNKTDIIDSLQIGQSITKEPAKIANEFGNYFSNVGKTFAKKTPKPKTNIETYIAKIEENNKSLFLYPTNTVEVTKLIDSLKNKKSSGPDQINNVLLKELKWEIVVPLTIIFNKSLVEGTFPDRMKTTDVIPLHKGKSKVNKEKYRPISLLLTLSKILEKILHT